MNRPPRVRRLTVSEGREVGISNYPNFSVTGSVIGMRKLYYGQSALLVRCGRYIYRVPPSIYYRAY